MKYKCRTCIIREGIIQYINDNNNYAPIQYRKIGRLIGVNYPQMVKGHIERMAKENIIKITKCCDEGLFMSIYEK